MKGKAKEFRVSDMKNPDYEFLVFIHELIEAHLCEKKGISINLIDDFDIGFEERRKKGNFDEPGNDKAAPYHIEHVFATKIEKILADALGVEWQKYDNAVNHL